MIETKTIKVRLADGTLAECALQISRDPACKLVCSGLGFDNREYLAEDLFNALIILRREFAQLGYLPLCAGARIDVYPSGMSRSMGGGRQAYILHLGRPGQLSDLLDIFDYAEPQLIASVEQQKEYHKQWVESLRLKQ